MSTAPKTPLAFSLDAIRPHLSRNNAAARLRTNAPLLAVYIWIWAMPGYYKYIRGAAIWTLTVVLQREWVLSCITGLEWLAFFLLAWNTYEAVYSLRHPPPMPEVKPHRPRQSLVTTPVALTAAHRRLRGTPKTPVPDAFSPSPNASTTRFPALSLSASRTPGTIVDSPSRLTTPGLGRSFASSLNASSSTFNSSYAGGELSRRSSRGGARALDTGDVNRILADL